MLGPPGAPTAPCAERVCPTVLCARAEYYDTYVRSASDQVLIPAVLRVRMYVSAREAMSARLTLSRRNIMLRDKCTCQCARAPASPVACTGARPPCSESLLAAALGLVVVPAEVHAAVCGQCASACCPGMVVRARLARRPARTLGGGAGLVEGTAALWPGRPTGLACPGRARYCGVRARVTVPHVVPLSAARVSFRVWRALVAPGTAACGPT